MKYVTLHYELRFNLVVLLNHKHMALQHYGSFTKADLVAKLSDEIDLVSDSKDYQKIIFTSR